LNQRMIELDELVNFLDQELRTKEISDYPGAMNGLQLANSGKISRIIGAVDASLSVVEAAAQDKNCLLIVHHGMFWQAPQPITHSVYRKLKRAMDADLAIYSSHLPLDVHPELGNNSGLARAIALNNIQPFFDHKGQRLGLRGSWAGSRAELLDSVSTAVSGPVHLCPGGPENQLLVGLITGGAGSEVAKVAACGVDTFITGEGPHWSYPLAEELGVNLFYAGHYATETFGVKSILALLGARFELPTTFVHRPTGL